MDTYTVLVSFADRAFQNTGTSTVFVQATGPIDAKRTATQMVLCRLDDKGQVTGADVVDGPV